MSPPSLLRSLAGVAALAIAGRAAAQGEVAALSREAARIGYHAPEGCPGEASFRERVNSRVRSAWEARPDSLAREVRVVVSTTEQGYSAEMRFVDAAGHPVVRVLEGADCEEVVTGMAIVTALAIDTLLAPSETDAAPAVPDAKSPPPDPRGDAAAGVAPLPASAPPQAERARWRHDAGVAGGLLWGLGPVPALLVAARFGTGPAGRADTVLLRLEAADTSRFAANGVEARFQLVGAHLEVCPVRIEASALVTLPICGGADAGLVLAQTYRTAPEVIEPRDDSAPWLALTAGPRLRVASRAAFVALVPEIRVPLAIWTYRVEAPRREVFATPWVASSLAIEAGARFP